MKILPGSGNKSRTENAAGRPERRNRFPLVPFCPNDDEDSYDRRRRDPEDSRTVFETRRKTIYSEDEFSILRLSEYRESTSQRNTMLAGNCPKQKTQSSHVYTHREERTVHRSFMSRLSLLFFSFLFSFFCEIHVTVVDIRRRSSSSAL